MEGPWTIAGTIIGAVVLSLTGWEIVIKPIWRQRRLKKPCKAWFVIQSLSHENMSYAVQDDKEHFIEELALPANSDVEIEVIYVSSISFVVSEIQFGCGEQDSLDLDIKPSIVSYVTHFVERGTAEEDPGTHPDHNYTDRHKYYHIRKSKIIAAGETYSLGFKIKTRKAGRYKAHLFFIGEKTASTKNELHIRVEDKPVTQMKCVRPEHRWDGCFVMPKHNNLKNR
jgi:hypothetical protein